MLPGPRRGASSRRATSSPGLTRPRDQSSLPLLPWKLSVVQCRDDFGVVPRLTQGDPPYPSGHGDRTSSVFCGSATLVETGVTRRRPTVGSIRGVTRVVSLVTVRRGETPRHYWCWVRRTSTFHKGVPRKKSSPHRVGGLFSHGRTDGGGPEWYLGPVRLPKLLVRFLLPARPTFYQVLALLHLRWDLLSPRTPGCLPERGLHLGRTPK